MGNLPEHVQQETNHNVIHQNLLEKFLKISALLTFLQHPQNCFRLGQTSCKSAATSDCWVKIEKVPIIRSDIALYDSHSDQHLVWIKNCRLRKLLLQNLIVVHPGTRLNIQKYFSDLLVRSTTAFRSRLAKWFRLGKVFKVFSDSFTSETSRCHRRTRFISFPLRSSTFLATTG